MCAALRDLLPFAQLNNCEKHPWKSATFSKVAGFKPATLLKVTLVHGCFSRFLIYTNGTKLRNALQTTISSHITSSFGQKICFIVIFKGIG